MKIDERHRLQSFLEQARRTGRFDSEGHFTLNRQKAAGKLAAFLLPRGGYWILKVVQGACSVRARRLAIHETPEVISFQLDFNGAPSHQDLRKLLLETHFDHPLADLAQGLRAVGAGEKRSWVGTYRHADQITDLSSQDGRLLCETRPLGSAVRTTTLNVTVELSTAQPANEKEIDLLHSKAVTCSIPLSVNGVRLDHLQFGHYNAQAQALPVGVHWVVSPDNNPLGIPPAVREQGRWEYVPAFTPQARVNRMIAVNYNYVPLQTRRDIRSLRVSSSLSLVRHGVIIRTLALNLYHPISVDVFMAADPSRVDISGLRGEFSPDLFDQAEEEVTAFNGSLRDLGRQVFDRPWSPPKGELLAWLGLSAAAFPLSAYLTPILGLSAVGWMLRHRAWDRKLRQKAADSLELFRRDLPIVIRR